MSESLSIALVLRCHSSLRLREALSIAVMESLCHGALESTQNRLSVQHNLNACCPQALAVLVAAVVLAFIAGVYVNLSMLSAKACNNAKVKQSLDKMEHLQVRLNHLLTALTVRSQCVHQNQNATHDASLGVVSEESSNTEHQWKKRQLRVSITSPSAIGRDSLSEDQLMTTPLTPDQALKILEKTRPQSLEYLGSNCAKLPQGGSSNSKPDDPRADPRPGSFHNWKGIIARRASDVDEDKHDDSDHDKPGRKFFKEEELVVTSLSSRGGPARSTFIKTSRSPYDCKLPARTLSGGVDEIVQFARVTSLPTTTQSGIATASLLSTRVRPKLPQVCNTQTHSKSMRDMITMKNVSSEQHTNSMTRSNSLNSMRDTKTKKRVSSGSAFLARAVELRAQVVKQANAEAKIRQHSTLQRAISDTALRDPPSQTFKVSGASFLSRIKSF